MIDVHLGRIDSTQTYAKTHVHDFAPDKVTCITAAEQTAGFGRFQRKWISPPDANLYATFYFQLPSSSLHLISLAQVMAYSLAAVLLSEGLHPKIKWPNDVLLNGKKVSGALCETRFGKETVDVFLGIGINVNMEAKELSEIDKPATSLKLETGRAWDKKDLLKKLQKQLVYDLDLFKKGGFAPFHSAIENLLAYRGEPIRCFDGKKEWVGICHSLTFDGQLNLLLSDKSMHVVSAGDIS